MATVSTYLNFKRNTEEAFNFYKSVFGGEFIGGIARFRDIPTQPGQQMPDSDANLVMHVQLAICGGHMLMGTDAPETMGFDLKTGDNMHISLDPDTKAEAKRLFDALSEGGKITMPIQEMFWGAYFGSFKDRFGINWMINCTAKV